MVKMYKCGIGIKIIYFRNTYNFIFIFFVVILNFILFII